MLAKSSDSCSDVAAIIHEGNLVWACMYSRFRTLGYSSAGADTGGGAMGALAPPFPKVGGSTVCARAASRNYNWTIYSK